MSYLKENLVIYVQELLCFYGIGNRRTRKFGILQTTTYPVVHSLYTLNCGTVQSMVEGILLMKLCSTVDVESILYVGPFTPGL